MKWSEDLEDYFSNLSLNGINLTEGQKLWYAKKKEILHEEILREYPSTPEEAFQSSSEGFWYVKQIHELYEKGHITTISHDKAIPVHTAWDLGQRDATSIWFFQINRVNEIMVIDYFEKTDTPLEQIAQMLQQKGYAYGHHIWPSDARARDRAGITFEQQAARFNLHGIVLEQHGLLDGINLVRTTLNKMWFDEKKCQKGLEALKSYKKKWDARYGGYSSIPVHDDASHGSDAMRYLCAGLPRIMESGTIADDAKALRAYWGSDY